MGLNGNLYKYCIYIRPGTGQTDFGKYHTRFFLEIDSNKIKKMFLIAVFLVYLYKIKSFYNIIQYSIIVIATKKKNK